MNRRKNNLFNEVPVMKVKRSMFDLSHEVKMSGKFGYLYPVLVMDTLPGDKVSDTMTAFARFAPMLAPVMHLMDISTHFFFVPNRILSDYFEEFITGGQDGLSDSVMPYVTPFNLDAAYGNGMEELAGVGSLWDYLGLPVAPTVAPTVWSSEQINVLPIYAYIKTWNDYYRDPNLDTEIAIPTELQGNVSAEMISLNILNNEAGHGLRKRGFEKDYFTGALPWAQRGASVLLPLAGTGTVVYSPQTFLVDETAVSAGPLQASATGGPTIRTLTDDTGEEIQLQNIESVILDESTITINDFRRTMAIQRWLENNARGGGRYIEQIQSHFNVRVPDFRLQRAEYLGGGKQKVVVSEVLATAESDDIPVGDMAGHGISVGRSNRFNYFCQEHGWVLGIMSITMKTGYSQGIHKMFSRPSKFDYAFPELAKLGEQEVLSKEIFMSYDADDNADNQLVFGYVPRYADYKFRNDRIAGDFHTTLGFWHLSRFFTERPSLDSEFLRINENGGGTPDQWEESFRRIFAVQDGTDYIWFQLFHRLTCMRPLPYFGVPSIM